MSRGAFRFLTRLYPRRWRERYGDELYDLCEELMNSGQTTRSRLAAAILVGAAAERFRPLRSTRGRAMAASSALLLIGLSTATLATGGLGLLAAGHTVDGPAVTGSSARALASPVLFHLGQGYVEATATTREPSGVMVRARLSAPRGVRAYAVAVLGSGATAQVEIQTVRNSADPWVSCQLQGGTNECTEAFSWCPMPSATWELRVVKQTGPAGPVRLDLYVGPDRHADGV